MPLRRAQGATYVWRLLARRRAVSAQPSTEVEAEDEAQAPPSPEDPFRTPPG